MGRRIIIWHLGSAFALHILRLSVCSFPLLPHCGLVWIGSRNFAGAGSCWINPPTLFRCWSGLVLFLPACRMRTDALWLLSYPRCSGSGHDDLSLLPLRTWRDPCQSLSQSQLQIIDHLSLLVGSMSHCCCLIALLPMLIIAMCSMDSAPYPTPRSRHFAMRI